ncbi:unnamed protein product [Hyaloperonospora brassicae]|uniref:RxLR effector candidate protein n=1 Tax=Hyaloperonospora brassicae TaxID=162125 RepID=A0AAV0UYN2_HYABA|nr:unnamed protein product [Hyaloperonospora brassicae]
MPPLLRLYPIFLACSALVGLSLCLWCDATELASRQQHNDRSLKYLLNSVPPTLAALLLLYYACTFARPSSVYVHRMILHSCLHQSVASLMLASLVFSACQASLSLCCTLPALCPVDPTAHQLHRIVACPASVAHIPHYNLCMRMIHSSATVTTLLALSTIAAAQSVNDLKARERHATLLTFARQEPVHEASAAVEL